MYRYILLYTCPNELKLCLTYLLSQFEYLIRQKAAMIVGYDLVWCDKTVLHSPRDAHCETIWLHNA